MRTQNFKEGGPEGVRWMELFKLFEQITENVSGKVFKQVKTVTM